VHLNHSAGIFQVTRERGATSMAQSGDKGRINVFQVMRDARDMGMDSWSKVVLKVTSSAPYSLATSAIAKPSLFLAAAARRRTDAWMGQVLARMNMPSRTDVLALSTRLTHIEVALDDLGAAVDSLRTQVGVKAAPAKRATANNRLTAEG
jgi:hypothetical protein